MRVTRIDPSSWLFTGICVSCLAPLEVVLGNEEILRAYYHGISCGDECERTMLRNQAIAKSAARKAAQHGSYWFSERETEELEATP